MFDLVANRKRLVQVVIVLITLPFALFGIDFYFRGVDATDQIAKVGNHAITPHEFGVALRDRQEQVRQMMKGKVNTDLLNGPEIKHQVIEQLVEEKLLLAAASEARLNVSDVHLRQLIHEIPAFKDEATGKFSKERYDLLLRTRDMSPAMFEADLRRRLLIDQVRDSVAATNFLPNTVSERLSQIRGQQRQVSQAILLPGQFLGRVKLEADEAKKYYDAHTNEFTLPERARVEYVVLSLESLQKQVQVSESDIQKFYQEHLAQFEQAEERRARHILISVESKASAEDKAKAKAKADAVLAEAKQSGSDFALLAKNNSQDPGSAVEGGDLGFFGRGRMAKPFDDALFSMKPGDVVGPVETQYGYHIIKLEEVKAGKREPIEQVRSKIEEEVKKSAVGRLYAEKAEQFSNLVYEQSDSLKAAADALKLDVEQSGWVTKDRADMPMLNNDKLLKAIFSQESVKNKRNTEAFEVAPNTLISAHIIEHVAATPQPFETVKEIITQQLTAAKAAELAKKDGEDKLARLRKGESISLQWSPEQMVSREKREGLAPEAAQAVFQVDVPKLPAYTAYASPDGRYMILRIGKVQEATTVNAEETKTLANQISTLLGREVHTARLKSLREKSKVKINKDRIEKG
jgi:peptidyl-prolyl cis-trans isomerase D